jgi:hypothetical protein
MKARQRAKIVELGQALVSAGIDSLDAQASALGLGRSTTWMILKANHKSSGLSASIVNRISSSPKLPAPARQIIEQYVREKMAGLYGHTEHRLRLFRSQMG